YNGQGFRHYGASPSDSCSCPTLVNLTSLVQRGVMGDGNRHFPAENEPDYDTLSPRNMTLSNEHRWQEFRRQMPVVGHWAYFDHAAISPLPGPTRDAIANWLTEAAEQGGPAWGHWDRRVHEVRCQAAKMVGAVPEEIALLRSTTEGVTLVAEGFPWQSGD